MDELLGRRLDLDLRVPLLVLLLLLQNKVCRLHFIQTGEGVDKISCEFQDVRPLPNLLLLWLHGPLLLLPRPDVRHPRLRGNLFLCQEDLLHRQDRLIVIH